MSESITVRYEYSEPLRLDKFLVDLKIQELYSRTFIEKLIDDDQILVNTIPVKKSYPLQTGDLITIHLPELEPSDIQPQNIPLDIIYEDDALAVINKPAGMIVHPGFGNPLDTLANAVMFRYGESLSGEGTSNRPGIVHRLDRGTSGLVIVAKHDAAQSQLSSMFANREIKKTYLAITTGIPEPGEDTIENHLSRSISNPRKMVVSDEGRWAVTHYSILHYYYFFALLKVRIETGRMHQIRVHLATRNYPILGDLLYNSIRQVQAILPDNLKKKVYDLLTNHLHRQALHAWKLNFAHPVTKQDMEFIAPLPADLVYTLNWLEQYFAIDKDGYDKKLF